MIKFASGNVHGFLKGCMALKVETSVLFLWPAFQVVKALHGQSSMAHSNISLKSFQSVLCESCYCMVHVSFMVLQSCSAHVNSFELSPNWNSIQVEGHFLLDCNPQMVLTLKKTNCSSQCVLPSGFLPMQFRTFNVIWRHGDLPNGK